MTETHRDKWLGLAGVVVSLVHSMKVGKMISKKKVMVGGVS